MFIDFRESEGGGERQRERQKERERERHVDVRNMDWLPPICAWSGD